MNRFRTITLALGLLWAGQTPALAQHVSTFDTVSDWTSADCPTIARPVAQTSFTATQSQADGNPAPGFAVDHAYDLRIAICHFNQSIVLDPAAAEIATLTFGLDARVADRRMGIVPLIAQDNVAYWSRAWDNADRTQRSVSATLTASDFVPVFALPGSTDHPDFGCGAAPIRVGFVTANQIGATNTPSGYLHERSAVIDNWSLDIADGEACGFDLQMDKTVRQAEVEPGGRVDFDFAFTQLAGAFERGDRLVVTDTLPKGFVPVDLPRFSNGDWSCSVTGRPTPTTGRVITCRSRRGVESIPPLTIQTTAPENRFGEARNCADLEVIRGNGGTDDETSNHVERCAVLTVLEPPAICALQVTAATPVADLAVGDMATGAVRVANVGGRECETVRLVSYVGLDDGASGATAWLQVPSEFTHAVITPAEAWRSPAEITLQMQTNVPNYQYSYPSTPVLAANAPPPPRDDLIWEHPARRPGYGGPATSNYAFQAGTVETLTVTPQPVTIPQGFVSCTLAVVSISDLEDLRLALHLAAANPPPNLSPSAGNDLWAASINDALAAAGQDAISCVGVNIR